jgi:hypothetical protein
MTKYTVSYETIKGMSKTKIEAHSPEDAYAQFHKERNLEYKVFVEWGPLGMHFICFDAHLKTDEEAQEPKPTASSSSTSSADQDLLQQILDEQKKSNFRLTVIACPA